MKRLLVVLFIVLASPVLVSVNITQQKSNSTSMVAYAGKTVAGGAYCTCGDPGCIVDPGECGGGHNTNSVTVANGRDTNTNQGSIDSASSVMLLAFALLILFRLGSR